MCGIWFSVGFSVDRERISRVAHRGPDSESFNVLDKQSGLCLGHRRLAILDVDHRADQPFFSLDDRFVLVFNGEIYNYVELRRELVALGHVFRTTSDTEVLLAALRQWGEAALPKLLGMFAFVLVDRERQSALAARDRFGIKPLYVVHNGHGVALASEIKQVYD